ncbi:hypothetical protein HYQ46_005179 [Verticillium longisporum]|nr:hypothetical protein HYQ46_005179 [Verticillium longisporum]
MADGTLSDLNHVFLATAVFGEVILYKDISFLARPVEFRDDDGRFGGETRAARVLRRDLWVVLLSLCSR